LDNIAVRFSKLFETSQCNHS